MLSFCGYITITDSKVIKYDEAVLAREKVNYTVHTVNSKGATADISAYEDLRGSRTQEIKGIQKGSPIQRSDERTVFIEYMTENAKYLEIGKLRVDY